MNNARFRDIGSSFARLAGQLRSSLAILFAVVFQRGLEFGINKTRTRRQLGKFCRDKWLCILSQASCQTGKSRHNGERDGSKYGLTAYVQLCVQEQQFDIFF
jgi:hypothetical protein